MPDTTPMRRPISRLTGGTAPRRQTLRDIVNRKKRIEDKTSAAQRFKNKFGKSRLGN